MRGPICQTMNWSWNKFDKAIFWKNAQASWLVYSSEFMINIYINSRTTNLNISTTFEKVQFQTVLNNTVFLKEATRMTNDLKLKILENIPQNKFDNWKEIKMPNFKFHSLINEHSAETRFTLLNFKTT